MLETVFYTFTNNGLDYWMIEDVTDESALKRFCSSLHGRYIVTHVHGSEVHVDCGFQTYYLAQKYIEISVGCGDEGLLNYETINRVYNKYVGRHDVPDNEAIHHILNMKRIA